MNYFCEQCAAKPGWTFDPTKTFQHSCQRCFQNRPCNDYSFKLPKQNVSAAPRPKDLVPPHAGSQSEVNLPRAKGVGETVTPMPQPVPEPVAAPELPVIPQNKTEADTALDAVQPNRPGVKLKTTVGKPAKGPKFEVAE